METKITTFQEYLKEQIKDCEQKELKYVKLAKETGCNEFLNMSIEWYKKRNDIQKILNQFNVNFER